MIAYIYLRCLGFIYILAFWSLGTQVLGLIGASGILPVGQFLHAARDYWGPSAVWHLPTICWWWQGDDGLLLLCFLGGALGLLLFAGILPSVTAALLWVLYLSLTVAGQDFMAFQWENLLLEAGFISIFLYPIALLVDPYTTSPSRAIIWLLRLLLFKLMFQSGLVKLSSGDASWSQLTALTYHYYTQPLPNLFAWYAHQWPLWMQKFSCLFMFFVELVVPFFIFLGRWPRLIAFFLFMLLQMVIVVTGNYGFFNLLTMALSLTLLDDAHLRIDTQVKEPLTMRIVGIMIAVLIGGLSLAQATTMAPQQQPKLVKSALETIAPFRTVNNYGLFAVMTKQRNEIIIEGSNDAFNWQEYEFFWKPGDVMQAPSWVMPHQPRLDWQMWFAALGNYQQNPWLLNTMVRMLEGSKQVLDLIKINPFPDRPPKYIRALMYEYHFTSMPQRKTTLDWWQRDYKGVYILPFTLGDVRRQY